MRLRPACHASARRLRTLGTGCSRRLRPSCPWRGHSSARLSKKQQGGLSTLDREVCLPFDELRVKTAAKQWNSAEQVRPWRRLRRLAQSGDIKSGSFSRSLFHWHRAAPVLGLAIEVSLKILDPSPSNLFLATGNNHGIHAASLIQG